MDGICCIIFKISPLIVCFNSKSRILPSKLLKEVF